MLAAAAGVFLHASHQSLSYLPPPSKGVKYMSHLSKNYGARELSCLPGTGLMSKRLSIIPFLIPPHSHYILSVCSEIGSLMVDYAITASLVCINWLVQ